VRRGLTQVLGRAKRNIGFSLLFGRRGAARRSAPRLAKGAPRVSGAPVPATVWPCRLRPHQPLLFRKRPATTWLPLPNNSSKPTPLRGFVERSGRSAIWASATLPQRCGLTQVLAPIMQNQPVVRTAITFLLVCPSVVWLLGCALWLVGAPASSGSWLSPYVVMLAFLSLVSAYVAAAGPALAIGAAFGSANNRWSMPALASLALGFALGFVAAGAGAYIVTRVDPTISAPPLSVGLAGGVAALVAALVVVRRLGANNSSKPTPLRGAA
jgi:hypothetical protein